MDLSKFGEYGLIGIFCSAVLFGCWKMIVWLMAFVKEDRKQQADEREKWLCRLEKLNAAMDKTADNIDIHDKRADERGRYVREEHKEMIDVLKRINGFKE